MQQDNKNGTFRKNDTQHNNTCQKKLLIKNVFKNEKKALMGTALL
jgi:hypothetical protein